METKICVSGEGYHLIGKIGCINSEAANLLIQETLEKNEKVKYHSDFLHETPYENQINLLKLGNDTFEFKVQEVQFL